MGPEKAGGQSHHVLGQALCWCFLSILVGEPNASGPGAPVRVEDGGIAWTELPPISSVNGDSLQSRALRMRLTFGAEMSSRGQWVREVHLGR